jgi:O-antigen ligase
MLMSWLVAFEPSLTLKPLADRTCGIFVKNYIDQGQEFGLCAVALIYPVLVLWKENRRLLAGLFIAAALGMVAHMMFVIASRTSLAIMPPLLAIFAFRHLQWRGIAMLALVTAIGAVAWAVTPRMCRTVETMSRDIQLYQTRSEPTSAGLRIEYWTKSVQFIREAPLFGHGTGSIRELFQKAATGHAVQASGHVVANPHNQTLAVAIQWGLIGTILLYAMWLLHLLLFRGPGLVAWIGLLVVAQNILSSLFNSHLFDFHAGWMYVLGVGVAGGTVLGARLKEKALPESAARP